MTQARANWILQNLGQYDSLKFSFRNKKFMGEFALVFEKGITPEEDIYIEMIWSMMDETTSYFNAVEAIAKGIG